MCKENAVFLSKGITFVKKLVISYQMNTMKLDKLPYPFDLETIPVLKALPAAHAALAELKGIALTIPNQSILINTLGIQEAKDSSAVENIITTHDELYKSELQTNTNLSPAAKEVQNYIAALKRGYDLVLEKGLITESVILEVQQVLEKNSAGYRKLPGTALKNVQTGEIVYTPPQSYDEIVKLMANLEQYINDNDYQNIDPLIKMAVIHFQFESIHPFYDGNGRTGRILNILYLIKEQLQNVPILYLSNYIIRNKSEYYRLLQAVRDEEKWEDWLLYIIQGIEETATETIQLILKIKELMQSFKIKLRENYKFYSHELLNNLFMHPYTKIEFLTDDLGVSRITAANYLNTLAEDGVLQKSRLGTTNYYINVELYQLLSRR